MLLSSFVEAALNAFFYANRHSSERLYKEVIKISQIPIL